MPFHGIPSRNSCEVCSCVCCQSTFGIASPSRAPCPAPGTAGQWPRVSGSTERGMETHCRLRSPRVCGTRRIAARRRLLLRHWAWPEAAPCSALSLHRGPVPSLEPVRLRLGAGWRRRVGCFSLATRATGRGASGLREWREVSHQPAANSTRRRTRARAARRTRMRCLWSTFTRLWPRPLSSGSGAV